MCESNRKSREGKSRENFLEDFSPGGRNSGLADTLLEDSRHRHSMKDIREEVMQRKVSAVREEDVLPVSKTYKRKVEHQKVQQQRFSSFLLRSLFSNICFLFDWWEYAIWYSGLQRTSPFRGFRMWQEGQVAGVLVSGHCLPEQLNDLMPVTSHPKDHFCISPTMPTSPGHSKV